MEPRNFNEYVVQGTLAGKDCVIRAMIEKKTVQSMVFYEPPASGKTGLARIIARNIDVGFISVNTLTLNSEDISKIFNSSKYSVPNRRSYGSFCRRDSSPHTPKKIWSYHLWRQKSC